nr:hypothetical protein [Tanacetum cinerariifolium]
MQTQTSNTLHNAIMEAGGKDRPPMLAPGSSVITTETYMETYKNVSQDIRDQLIAKAEAVQIILTWIDNDIYSIVDACSNAFYHPQNHPTHYTQNSSTRSQQAAIKNKGKAIVNSPLPIHDQKPSMVAEDDEMSKDKEIDKLMALISLSLGNVVGARENVGTTMVQKSRIQCHNCKEFCHVERECQKPKRVKDATYQREKMLLYQFLEAHYMYMAQIQEVSPDTADSGPIFDVEPLQKVSNDNHYNVFAIQSEHPEQSKSVHDTYLIKQDEHNVIIDSLDMSYDREQIN